MNVRRHPSSFPAAVLDASPSTTPSTPTNRPLHPTPAAATTSQPASTHEADKPAYRPCLSFILDGHRLEHIDKGHKWIEDATSIMQKLSLGEDDPELARWKPQIALVIRMANELQNRKGFWPRFVWVLILNPREFSHNARQVLLVARNTSLKVSNREVLLSAVATAADQAAASAHSSHVREDAALLATHTCSTHSPAHQTPLASPPGPVAFVFPSHAEEAGPSNSGRDGPPPPQQKPASLRSRKSFLSFRSNSSMPKTSYIKGLTERAQQCLHKHSTSYGTSPDLDEVAEALDKLYLVTSQEERAETASILTVLKEADSGGSNQHSIWDWLGG